MWTDRRVFQHCIVALWEEDITNLRLAVQALQPESGTDLRTFLAAHPEYLRDAVRAGSLVDINDAALRLFEADSADQLLAWRTSADTVFQGLCGRLMLAIAGGEREVRYETAARTVKGGELFLRVQSILPGDDEQPQTALVHVVDISDRLRLERTLQDTESRFADTIAFLPDATFAINAEGVVTAWNRAIEEMTGVSARDMVGKGNYEYAIPFYGVRRPLLIDLVRESNEEIEQKYHLGRKQADGILIAETRIADLKGKEVFLWGKASLLFDVQGRDTGAIESIRDITDRVRSQAALRSSEERHRFFTESSFDGLAISQDGVLIDVTPQTLDLLGYRLDEMVGRPSSDFAIPGDRDEIKTRDREMDETTYETKLISRTGEPVDVEMRSRYFVYKDRRVRVTAIRDIGDRKRTEEALRNLQKLESLATLAGGIAHDFNNQLTGILGNISLVLHGLPERSEHQQLLKEAQDSCVVARSLTRQLLTFASGGEPVTQVEDLSKILREQAVFATRGANVKCLTDRVESPLPARVDPQQIRQVVQNLVLNAVQAMPNGGTVKVGGSVVELGEEQVPLLHAGRYIEVTVEDEGDGIALDRLDKVFDPFYSTKSKGRGLGLSVCHSIVGRHLGRISVVSTPGKGSVFTMHLPAASLPASSREERLVSGVVSRGGTVLIMDDEPAVARVLSAMLRKLGFVATAVPDGAAALSEYLRARDAGQPYSFVIMDMTIPGGMGGKEAIVKLRALEPEVKAIVSSGYSDSADFAGSGFSGVLPKPYVLADLEAVIERVIGEPA
jgi:PAS domain S-box-containing protein